MADNDRPLFALLLVEADEYEEFGVTTNREGPPPKILGQAKASTVEELPPPSELLPN